MAALHVLLNLLLLLIILVGALPFSFWLLRLDSRHLRSQQNSVPLTHALLVLLTGWSVTQVGLGLLVGMLGQLKLLNVILAELLIIILGIVLIVKTKHDQNHGLSTLVLALRQANRSTQFMVYSIAMMGLFLLVTIATSPVIDYDSLWFHLPTIARWYQTGSLTLLDPSGHWIFEHPDAAKYPYNWHILSLLCLLPLGTDFLITFPNLLAWNLIGLAVYRLSRGFGATQFYSIAATTLLLSMPFLMQAVNGAQPDLALAAIFTVCLYFAYSFNKTRSSVEFFLFTASAGLLCGIKIPGIIYAVVAGGFWAVLEVFRRFEPQPINQASPKQTGLVVLGWVTLIFLGGYWYVHNLQTEAISLDGLSSNIIPAAEPSSLPKPSTLEEILRKLNEYQKSTLTAQFNPISLSHWRALISQLVSRLQLPFVALTSQIILIPYIWFRYPKRCRQRSFMTASALFLISGFLYWNTPYSSGTAGLVSGELSPLMGNNMRYGFSGVAMGAVMAAVVATVMRPPRWMIVAIVWLSGVLGLASTAIFYVIKAQVFAGQRNVWLSQLLEQALKQPGQFIGFGLNVLQGSGLYPLLLALIYAVTSLWIFRYKNLDVRTASPLNPKTQRLKPRSGLLQSAIVLVVLIGFLVSVGSHAKHQFQAKLYREIYEYLEQTVGTSHKIAYFSSPRNYLLYGEKFQQTVLHKSANLGDPTKWLKELRQEQVRFVAVGPELNRQSAQGRFLQDLINKGVLKTDFGQDPSKELVVFRLQPAND